MLSEQILKKEIIAVVKLGGIPPGGAGSHEHSNLKLSPAGGANITIDDPQTTLRKNISCERAEIIYKEGAAKEGWEP